MKIYKFSNKSYLIMERKLKNIVKKKIGKIYCILLDITAYFQLEKTKKYIKMVILKYNYFLIYHSLIIISK